MVPVPPRTPAGALTAVGAVASALELASSLLLANPVSELKQNKLDTASASRALKITFEFNVCIIVPPLKTGARAIVKTRTGFPRLWQTGLRVNTFHR
jgi:hypothetical protein